MPKATKRRTKRKRSKEWLRLTLRVAAASVHVDRLGPKILMGEPEGEASSSINIEGTLDRPAFKALTRTRLLVLEREERTGDPGTAIGGTIVWNVVATLPREQFADLVAMVLADKLQRVEMGFEEVKRGTGTMRTISFKTAPVPGDAEDEEEGPPDS